MNHATYEVEMKFRVSDLATVEAGLQQLGATRGDRVVEEDAYFNHPNRDFAQTDEAFRIRRCGPSSWLTYKGPKLDRETKTRQEIEIALSDEHDTYSKCAQILTALSFREVAVVRKERTRFALNWENRSVEVTLDEVTGVGTFVEIEICTNSADLEKAKAAVQRLASRLELTHGERRSYLSLLLEAQGKQRASEAP